MELWVQWLAEKIKIQEDGRVICYAEWWLPGWLLLQIGRSIWPNINDRRPDGRLTSISILGLLRRSPDNGYMVDRTSFINWLHITNYDGEKCQAGFKWMHINDIMDPSKCYQVLTPGQVCAGMHRMTDELCWVEIPDLNLPIPLLDFLDL